MEAVAFILDHTKTFGDPAPKLLKIIRSFNLDDDFEPVCGVMLLVERLQVFPEGLFVLSFKAFEIAPSEAVQEMALVTCVVAKKLFDPGKVRLKLALELTLNRFDFAIHGL